MQAATRRPLPEGRWHWQHGPIDIVVGANGAPEAVADAHDAAWQRFTGVLEELVAELPTLRQPVQGPCPLQGGIARRMWLACRPYRAGYITPMAAVAGAVAQELIGAYRRPGIDRAWVNNGGDIALHLAPGHALRVGLFADLARLDARSVGRKMLLDADFSVDASHPVRGIATSGWRGRSHSLGIADSVTALARTAAEADAAATVIANAVNCDDPRIERRPARELKDDSDLGDLPVTVHVPPLDADQAQLALAAGRRRTDELRRLGLLWSALLVCQGWVVSVGDDSNAAAPRRVAVEPGRAAGIGSVFAT